MHNDFKTVEKVLKDFISFFCQNPMNFQYEADIQGMLFTRLFDAMQKTNKTVPLQTWIGKEEKWNTIIRNNNINPVKTEYPSGEKLDIAIIESATPKIQVKDSWHMPIQIGIEIKFCQFDEAFSNKFGASLSDIQKLKTISEDSSITSENFIGISLLFIQYEKCSYYRNIININNLIKRKYKELISSDCIQLNNEINGWVIIPDGSIYRYDFK